MIERATSAEFINAVVNHPAVRPHVHGRPGPLDLTAVVNDPNHLVLQGEHGGMVLIQSVSGVYELHTQVLPAGRGAWAKQMADACIDYLFCRTNATEVITRVPAGNIAAAALTRACGAKIEERVYQDLGTGPGWVEIYSGRLQDWIKIAGHLPERGRAFHAKLKEKYQERGLSLSIHDDNDWHDRHVGAAAGMITGGMPIKGERVFNRWAAMAMAPPIKVLSLNPLIIDITDCKIEVQGEDFGVITCQ